MQPGACKPAGGDNFCLQFIAANSVQHAIVQVSQQQRIQILLFQSANARQSIVNAVFDFCQRPDALTHAGEAFQTAETHHHWKRAWW